MTVERTVYGDDMAMMVAWKMASLSCWFEFTPLPDGFYRFTFKDESGLVREVDKAISEAMDEIAA